MHFVSHQPNPPTQKMTEVRELLRSDGVYLTHPHLNQDGQLTSGSSANLFLHFDPNDHELAAHQARISLCCLADSPYCLNSGWTDYTEPLNFQDPETEALLNNIRRLNPELADYDDWIVSRATPQGEKMHKIVSREIKVIRQRESFEQDLLKDIKIVISPTEEQMMRLYAQYLNEFKNLTTFFGNRNCIPEAEWEEELSKHRELYSLWNTFAEGGYVMNSKGQAILLGDETEDNLPSALKIIPPHEILNDMSHRLFEVSDSVDNARQGRPAIFSYKNQWPN